MKLKLERRGTDGDRVRTIAGSTATVRMTVDDPAFLAPHRPPIDGVFWESDGESALTVP